MAPIRPRSRAAHRTKPTLSTTPSPSSLSSTTTLRNPYATPHRSNASTPKNAKRADKHALLLSRLQSSTFNPSKITKAKAKPRRPKRKMVTGLEDLVDALPEADVQGGDDGADAGTGKRARVGNGGEAGAVGGGWKLQKSMKSKPGAMKKRAKVLEGERERFAKNLGVMCSKSGDGGVDAEGAKEGAGSEAKAGEGTSARWAAIRRFVEGDQGTGEI